MKYEFHYGENAIIDKVFYATFAIVYTRVKINVHPFHDGHSYTMQSLFRCHIYNFSCIFLKLKYKTLTFSSKYQKGIHICNANKFGIFKMQKHTSKS
jgi:hypothetical protein